MEIFFNPEATIRFFVRHNSKRVNNKRSDEELKRVIEGCKKNDRKSQKILFEMQYGMLLSVCLRYVRDIDEAKDVLQIAFIKVFEKIGSYTSDGSLEGWMKRIVVNTAIDHIRKSKNDPLSIEENSSRVNAKIDRDQEEFDYREMLQLKAQDAMDALNELSEGYRTVFSLYVLENYTHREIAEILNISEGTSKSNLAKAKQNLRLILEKKFEKYEE